MTISDLSYLETVAETQIEGSGNNAYVSQYAYAAAGNNNGYKNFSYGNVANAINIAAVNQYDNDYYYKYYPYKKY